MEKTRINHSVAIEDAGQDLIIRDFFFIQRNPFGYSSRRISDLYCGLVKDTFAQWKHLRKTTPNHNPIEDAKGNAEVLLHLKNEMGLKISLK